MNNEKRAHYNITNESPTRDADGWSHHEIEYHAMRIYKAPLQCIFRIHIFDSFELFRAIFLK